MTLDVPAGDLYPNLIVDFFPQASSISTGGSIPAGEKAGTASITGDWGYKRADKNI